jgi:hypothetical protein
MRSLFVLLLLIVAGPVMAQERNVESRIVLIGDAGALVNGRSPVLTAARKAIPFDKKTTVVYLGDNLYRYGLPDYQVPTYEQSKAVLDSQISIADGTPSQVYFIPGNHDWMNGDPAGLYALRRQQRYIDALSGKNVHFLPKDGCPGPEEINLSENVVLVIMDSQWWLHTYEKPGLESDCDSKTTTEVIDEIKDIIAKNDRKLLLFACHHPFRSNGPHGGYYGIKQHIFPLTDIRPNLYIPLPIIGSIYPISRGVFGTPQDPKHPRYANMITEVEAAVRTHPHPVFVNGHEHALQFFKDTAAAFIVSGSGCKTNRVQKSKRVKYVADSLGFAVVTVYTNKTSDVQFYTVTEDGNTINASFHDSLADFSKIPALAAPDTAQSRPLARYEDSVTVAAGPRYATGSKLKKFIMGHNYRDVWAAPVRMKVFKLREEHGGMKITGKGGGQQTRSLRLKSADGREWTLRTIDKDPEAVLPEGLRGTFAKSIVQDVISSAHPYAPLTVPVLADAIGVPHANPEIVFVPNDPILGYYRTLFANQVCLLEERAPVPKNVKTLSSSKTFNKIIDENDHRVNQEGVLRARLLDVFIGDWDRHFDQWRFEVDDTGKGKLYEAIPRDRDQVFFNNDGVFVQLAALQRFPQFAGFKHKIKKVDYLGFNARFFDRVFMTDLDAEEWRRALEEFDRAMTDQVIEKAVSKLPKEIYALTGEELVSKLKSRKQQMMKQGMEYYRFISHEVNVLGSNNRERFDVSGNDSGFRVKVYELKKSGDTDFVMYDRQFDPKVTKDVRLFGFNSDDRFYIDSNVNYRGVTIRMIGGKGNDSFDVHGRTRNFLYDLNTEKNEVLSRRNTDYRFSPKPSVNDYDPNDFKYGRLNFPSLNLGYNPEDGLLVGAGFVRVTQGFRALPFKTQQRFTALFALREQAYRLSYRGEFVDLLHKKDLVVNALLHNPTVNNFFGLGNDTKIDPGKDLSYYRVRYKFATADLLVRKRVFQNKLSLSAGPTAYYYWNRPVNNEGKILETPSLVGLDSSVYKDKMYLGGKLAIGVNNLNSTLFPTRGIDWTNELVALRGISGDAKPLTRLTSEMNVYASLSDPARLVAVLRLGGGHIFSKDFEYFQALGVGQNNYLRGFRRNRFTGQSLAYGSLELRAKLLDINSYILPGTLGLVGFGDVARVWAPNEESKKWHATPGAGFYYIPYNLILVSGTVAFSEEQTLFNLTIGTRFNLTF